MNEYAFTLFECADKLGILYVLAPFGGNIKVQIPITRKLCEQEISALNLSVRSTNGLRRAGANTIGELIDLIMTEKGLLEVRNLGRKSISEIKTVLLVEAYEELNDRERLAFWCDFAMRNPKPELHIGGGIEDAGV